MKVLKLIGIVLVVLIVLFLLVAAFLPADYDISRQIVVNRPASYVYPNVAVLTNWQKWSPWYALEPDANYIYSEPDSGVGANYSWQGEIVGSGSLAIVAAVENESVEGALEFTEPQSSRSTNYFYFDETDSSTTVTWGMQGELGYPIERFFGLFFEDMIGPDFEKGLENLKKVSESKPLPVMEEMPEME